MKHVRAILTIAAILAIKHYEAPKTPQNRFKELVQLHKYKPYCSVWDSMQCARNPNEEYQMRQLDVTLVFDHATRKAVCDNALATFSATEECYK